MTDAKPEYSCARVPPPRERHRRDHDDDERNAAAASDPALERIPTIREGVAQRRDRDRPHDRAEGVVKEKDAPAKAAGAGQQRAENAQAGHEPGDEDRLRPESVKEPI